MKHNILALILIVFSLFVQSSCTQNNGNIGEWFGLWKLNSITVDGAVDEDYEKNIFFAFQGKVFGQVKVSLDDNGSDWRFANWDDEGDYFIITYAYVTDDDGNPVYGEDGEPECLYEPHSITRMSMGENIVQVDYIKGDDLQLSMTDAAGEEVVYNLEKW